MSWQLGSMPRAAISALRSRVRAIIWSLSEASGSFSISATCFRCDALSVKQIAFDASFDR